MNISYGQDLRRGPSDVSMFCTCHWNPLGFQIRGTVAVRQVTIQVLVIGEDVNLENEHQISCSYQKIAPMLHLSMLQP